MIGDLYNWISTTLVGDIPLEFQFIIPILVIFVVILVLYATFSGFILIKDILGGR